MAPWFNVRKAAEVAAFFAMRSGGQINVLKLVKLIYLSDRAYMEKYDVPILKDRLVSIDHGPVNSLTYNLINGTTEDASWEDLISDRADHMVGLKHNVTVDDLSALSDAELEVLEKIWADFGHMGKYQIRDYTHENCPEWDDPEGSSVPIRYSHVFKFLGKERSAELEDRVLSERQVAAKLA